MKHIYFLSLLFISTFISAQTWETNKAKVEPDGCLSYEKDANQNRIPDFSNAGFKGGGVAMPDVPVMQTISPIAGDNTVHIQNAINAVGAMPLDANGFRGAVLLNPGIYEVSGELKLDVSGVVLRGSGDGRDTSSPTIILGTGNVPNQRDLIELGGGNTGSWDNQVPGTQQNITANFVQVGSREFEIADASSYAVGDNIIILHPSTQAWLDAIDGGGTGSDPNWSVGQYNILYNRFITGISGNQITIDAPVFNHLDQSLSQSYIYKFDRQDMITNVGIENLRIDIIPSDVNDPFDESHAWSAIAFHEAEDGWARNITATGFGYAGVKTRKASRITVVNVHAIDPISLIDGGRRYNFAAGNFSNNVLFDNCYANDGRHTYAVNGTPTASGIVFLRCVSENPLAASEPHRQWSNGILYDNFRDFGTFPGNQRVLGLYNRGSGGTSHGWSAVNSVIWNADLSRPGNDADLILEKPPIGQNYAIGVKGDILAKDNFTLGYVENNSNPNLQLSPASLYEAQLLCRTSTVISNFTASSTTVAPGETVTFTEDAQGSISSYIWNFGQDASPPTATGSGPHTVSYSTSGQKTVSLIVSNGTQIDQEIKSPFISVEANNLSAVDDNETLDQNSSVTTNIVNNDVTPTPIPNKALLFNGSSDDLSGGSVFYDQTDLISDYPFTMMAWFKTTSTANRTILYFGNSSSNLTRHSVMLNNGSILMEARVRFGPGNTVEENISYSASLNDGTWHHVAAVHESPNSRKLYVDGVEVGSNTNNFDSVTPQPLSSFSAGNRDDGTPDSFFNGEIDDVRLYGSSLTDAEITNASQGYECSAGERIIKWDFNNQPNAEAEDQFNSFNGTISGNINDVSSTLSIGDLDATIISGPLNGTASFTNDFEITYTPNSGFIGTDSLIYQLRFGDCQVSQATITYNVQTASCTVPTNLQVTNITETNADISWDNVADATEGYDYVLITDGTIPDASTTPDASLTNGNNAVSFTNLTGGTDYDFYVRSNCGSGAVSDWSVVLSFTTLTPPPTGNTALLFDGIDDKVSFGTFSNPPDATAYSFTMTAWYKTTTTGDQFITYKGRSSSNFIGHTIRMISGIVRLEAVLGSGSANTIDILDNETTNDGEWHHVAAVFESPTSRSLYVDGILKGTDTQLADVFNVGLPVRFSVGVRDDTTPNGFFNGEIDEVRIYESALSQSQVHNVMNGLSCSNYGESLYYDFNDITLPTVEDEFGNQDGTITGATIVSSPFVSVTDTSPDTDTDGVSDACDLDSDNDGILNEDERITQNVALLGTANQSSTNFSGVASRAIDGITDGNYNNNSVTHTDNNSTTEYWEVDLGENYNLSEIIFYNRTNCCSDRISNVFVFVADTPFPSDVNDLAGSQANADFTFQFASGESASSVTIPVNQIGRYVRLQKSGTNIDNVLSIAELEIYSENVDTDTDSDGAFDHLDLDSDNDGCSDANEYYENSVADNNADGNDDDEYGNTATQSVDAFGKVIGAPYNGSASGLSNLKDENIAEACTFIQNNSGSFNTATNWSTNAIPQANQLAIIDNNVNSTITTDRKIKRLTLRANSQLNINPLGILSLAESITNEGQVIFESDATGTAQLDVFTGSISGSGEFRVERYIPAGIPDLRRAFRFLSSSVNSTGFINANWQEGATTEDTTPNPNPGYGTHITGGLASDGFDQNETGNPSMFTFSNGFVPTGAQTQNDAWMALPNTNSKTLKAGEAYLTLIRGDRSIDVTSNSATPTNTTLRATGDMHVGPREFSSANNTTTPEYGLSDQEDLYSLVGNPYQAIVDFNNLTLNNVNSNFYWVWDANMGARGQYATVMLPGGSNNSGSQANQFIQPSQSFFVQTEAGGPASLTFNEDDKNTFGGATTIFSEQNEPSINLLLYSTDAFNIGNRESDGVLINFSENSSNAIDQFDADKFEGSDENLARLHSNELISIENRATPADDEILDLSITGYTEVNYTFVVNASNVQSNFEAYLLDNYTGTETQLNEGSTQINFSVDTNIPASIASDRFSLVFENTTLGVDENNFGADFSLYPNPTRDGRFSIKTPNLSGEVTVEISNLLGQKVSIQELSVEDQQVDINAQNLSTGLYVVKLSQANQFFNSKLIVE